MNNAPLSDRTHEERLTYAFGHLVSGYGEPNAHSADSTDLGVDELAQAGLSDEAISDISVLAEYVAGNYEYTGEAREYARKIEAGEI